MKRIITATAVLAIAFVLGTALDAAAWDTSVVVHGPHGQSDCEKSQARLSVSKEELPDAPAAPVGFAPYTAGPVTGDDNAWHVTLTGPPFAPEASGTWAGEQVTVPAFEGNDNCTPPPPPPPPTVPTVPPCEVDDSCTPPPPPVTNCEQTETCPPIEQPNEPRPIVPPANTAPAVPTSDTPSTASDLPTTGNHDKQTAAVGMTVLLAGLGLLAQRHRMAPATRGIERK